MTVKELAEFTGKNETTVQRWVKKANCKMQLCNDKMQLQKGHETDFTLDEVEAILTASSLSKDAVSILMQNARASQSNKDIAAGASNGKGFSENDMKLIATIVSMTVRETMQAMDKRVTAIEDRVHERAALLPPPQISPRTHINMLMRDLAHNKNMEYRDAWKELYKQFGYRTNSNPAMCAQNRDMKIIDYIDAEGQMGILESVAMEICR